MLHGGLQRHSVLVIPEGGELRVRLVDWDHVAVGPAYYDISTFLSRFPPGDRRAILQRYRDAAEPLGFSLPAGRPLAVLFDTAEFARLANRLIWPALAVADGNVEWGFQALAEVERRIETHEPILPSEAASASVGSS